MLAGKLLLASQLWLKLSWAGCRQKPNTVHAPTNMLQAMVLAGGCPLLGGMLLCCCS
jgi:hypothetical protein